MKKKSIFVIGSMMAPWPMIAATLSSGHVDFLGVGYDGGIEPHSHAHEAAIVDGVALAADTEFEAGELTLAVVGSATRDADSAWAPIGVASGVSYWTLSQIPVTGEPFAGIGTEELVASEWASSITITLTGMVAPAGGVFSLWQTDPFEVPNFYMSTLDGISSADHYAIAPEGHAHFGWGFTAPGDYELTFEFSGIHATDGAQTASASYHITVIPEPSASLMSLCSIGAWLLWRKRR